MALIDALVMGRNTFVKVCEVVDEFGWPYGDTPVIVLSSSPSSVIIPPSLAEKKIRLMQGTPQEVLAKIETELGAKDVYVDGGVTIRGFLEASVVARVAITPVPATLGAGIPLFTAAQKDCLRKVGEAKKWENGFVQTTYTVQGDSS